MNTSRASAGLCGLVTCAILAAFAVSSGAVFAADSSSAGVTVKYADLDITTPSGAHMLYERIRAAAQNACSYFWFKTDADEARCVQNTIVKAVTKVNEPALSAVYNAKYKTSAAALVSQSR